MLFGCHLSYQRLKLAIVVYFVQKKVSNFFSKLLSQVAQCRVDYGKKSGKIVTEQFWSTTAFLRCYDVMTFDRRYISLYRNQLYSNEKYNE